MDGLTRHRSRDTSGGNQVRINNGLVEFDFSKTLLAKTGSKDVNALAAGETLTDSFTYSVMDNGKLSWATATVSIVGQNDAATFNSGVGIDKASVTESVQNGVMETKKAHITVTDVDHGQSTIKEQISTGKYGFVHMEDGGNWVYDLTSDAVAGGVVKHDLIHVKSVDGTDKVLDITVTGANDAATISGDKVISAGDIRGGNGSISIKDADEGESHANATSYAGAHGTLNVITDANGVGTMTFVANDAGHALAQNDKATDTFTVVSADGTAKQVVTVNITGQNDAATFTGDVAKTIGENGSTVAGTVTATDLDHDQSSMQAHTYTGQYGSLAMGANGQWTYSMAAQHDELNATDTLTDTIAVKSFDGTTQNIVVTIQGSNDAATFTGDVAKTIGENGSTVAGAVTATDLDHDQSSSLVYYSFPDQKLSQFPSQLKPS